MTAAENDEVLADIKPALFALTVCQLGLHSCMHGMRVAIPLQALSQGYTALTVGVLVAMFAVIPAIFAISFGRLTDEVGYHAPVRFAALLCIASGLTLAFSDSLYALGLGAALCGAGSGFGVIAIQRTASNLSATTAGRIRIFSWIALAPALAGLIGPSLAGLIIDNIGYRMAFAALGCLPVLTLLFSASVPNLAPKLEPKKASEKPTKDVNDVMHRGPKKAMDLLRNTSMRQLLFINVLVAASWDLHSFVIPILGHERGFSATAIGGIFAAFSAASITIRVVLPIFSKRVPAPTLMLAAISLAAITFAVYPMTDSALGMAVCGFVFGIAIGSVHPVIMATLHDVTPSGRIGESLAIRSLMTQVSMATTPLVFGLVGLSMGAPVLLWTMAGILSLGGWQSTRLFSNMQKTNSET